MGPLPSPALPGMGPGVAPSVLSPVESMVDWAGQSAQGRPWAEIHDSVGTKVATGVPTLQPMGATPALSLIYLLGEFSLPGGQQWIDGFLGRESRVALQTQSPIRKKGLCWRSRFRWPHSWGMAWRFTKLFVALCSQLLF